MPDLSKLRRGAEAIDKAQEKSEGNFERFTPTIFWSDPAKDKDNSAKYVLFLNPVDESFTASLISYLPVGGGKRQDGSTWTSYDSVIAKTDPVYGEKVDPLAKDWNYSPKETTVTLAVELEPELEEDERGRAKPVGFRVKTETFNRKVRDEKGEATDETEEVERPVVGFVQQSPHNFFNLIRATDADTAPIEVLPLLVTRVDQKTYKVKDFEGVNVELEDLFETVLEEGWLNDESKEAIEKVLDDEDLNDEQVSTAIGAIFLDQRIAQLADEERYQKIYDGITEPARSFGGGGNSGGNKASANRKERTSRRSQRGRAKSDGNEADAPAEAEVAEAQESAPDEKPKRGRGRAAKSGDSDEVKDRLAKLRNRASTRGT